VCITVTKNAGSSSALDNEPVVNPENLEPGQELAISYGQIREHRKPWEFQKN
jgi:hypothetical protein